MRKHWLYFRYLAKHKWYVFLECCKVGLYWRGVVHDWQKFTPTEWFPYAESFYGAYAYDQRPPVLVDAFNRAWLHHIHHGGEHHWQHWLVYNIIIGSNLVANDERDTCQCLSSLGKNQKFVQDVKRIYSEANFSMEGKLDATAKTVTQSKPKSIKRKILKSLGNIIGITMLRTPKSIASGNEIFFSDTENKFWNTMVVRPQNVLVVENNITSFWRWIISMVVGNSIARKMVYCLDYLHIDGWSKTNSPQCLESCATTAIQPMVFTVTVPIRKLKILVNDDGTRICLNCNKPLREDSGETLLLEIPERYRQEMICDWIGAGRALGKYDPADHYREVKTWYTANREKIQLHPATRNLVERELNLQAKMLD
jgi:hypothetical protein